MQLRLRSTELECLSNFSVNTICLTECRFWFSGSEFGAWAADFLSSSQMLLELYQGGRKEPERRPPPSPLPASMPQELWFLRHLVVRTPLAAPSKRRPDDVWNLPNRYNFWSSTNSSPERSHWHFHFSLVITWIQTCLDYSPWTPGLQNCEVINGYCLSC